MEHGARLAVLREGDVRGGDLGEERAEDEERLCGRETRSNQGTLAHLFWR